MALPPAASPPLGKNCYVSRMTMMFHSLVAGAGWRVNDIVCNAGPSDRPFEEQRSDVAIAVVTEGSFQYRTRDGAAVLVPGSLLLGNAGACFECGHEHAGGDRGLSFDFSPERFGAMVADVPGVRRAEFTAPRLPPMPTLMPLVAAAEAARDDGDTEELEELSLRFAGAVATLLG